MADTATRFRNFLKSNAAVKARLGERIYMDRVPDDKGKPYLWYRRMTIDPEDTTDAAAGASPISETFEVEVISPVESETQAITDLILYSANSGLALSDYRGTFDDTTVDACFVTDREGGHAPKGIGEAVGLFFTGFNVQIVL
jgi:hypothetical protein